MKYIFRLIRSIQKKTTRENLLHHAIKSLDMKRPICLIDVGSAKGMMSRWSVVKNLVYTYGFEPDSIARQKLKQNPEFLGGGNIDYPHVLSDNIKRISFNILKKPSHSSVLEPNNKVINYYPHRHPEGFEIDNKVVLNAYDLDSLDFEAKDFMKIDVQGYELKVLKGAKSSLKELIGLEIEVTFIELYKKQCSFGEVFDYMIENNFEFIDFTHLTRWERDSDKNTLGRCIGGDALFLRTPEFINEQYKNCSEKLAAYLSICLIYKRYDLIFTTLKLFDLEKSAKYMKFANVSRFLRKRLLYSDRISRVSNHIIRSFITSADASSVYY